MSAKKLINISSLSNFIQREVRNEDFSIKRIIQSDPDQQILSGNILGPLKVLGTHNGLVTLRGNNIYFSRFRAGEPVEIAIIDQKTKKLSVYISSKIKQISFPEPGQLEVIVQLDFPKSLSGDLFLLPKSFSGIKKTLDKRLWDLSRNNTKAGHHLINRIALKENFNHLSEHLNDTQKDALKFLVDNDLKGLIQGPPGTGKTQLLVALVNLSLSAGLRVGIASLSHSAVDNALSRVVRSHSETTSFLRIASNRDSVKLEPYGDFDINQNIIPRFVDIDGESIVYAATLHSWCMSNSPSEIDLLIIDEASQIPLYFYPFLDRLCSRVIMFGDHNQLPPVIQNHDHDLPADDIFSFEISRGKFPMLETQYRMNEGIQQWSSNRFYGGRLKPDNTNRNRDVLNGKISPSGLLGTNVVNLIGHDFKSAYQANPGEAKKVSDLVFALKTEGAIPIEEIGIVTPFRAQAGAICAALQEKLGVDEAQRILVDTVERFQGQEREAIVLSMASEKDESSKGAETFLGDGRRLNVSITRAKSRFYCLATNSLIDESINSAVNSDLKSFLSWSGKK